MPQNLSPSFDPSLPSDDPLQKQINGALLQSGQEQLGVPPNLLHQNEPLSNPVVKATLAAGGMVSPGPLYKDPGALAQMLTGTPGIVGGAPEQVLHPVLPPSVNLPGLNMTMSGPQAAGPAARQLPYQQPNAAGTAYGNPQSRNAAVVDNMFSNIQHAVMQHKQEQFENEAATMQQFMDSLNRVQQLKNKTQSGEQLTPQDLQTAAQSGVLKDPKQQKVFLKLWEKAQKDPMSGAYIGIQRFYQNQQQQAALQGAAAKQNAEILKDLGTAAHGYSQGTLNTAITKAMDVSSRIAAANARIQQGQEKIEADFQKQKTAALDKGIVLERDPQTGQVSQRLANWKEMPLPTREKIIKERRDIDVKVKNHDDDYKAKIAQQKLDDRRLSETERHNRLMEELRAREIDTKAAGGANAKIPAQEQDRMYKAQLVLSYAKEMKEIADAHPEMFGPEGWSKNKLKTLFGQQDPVAKRFMTLADMAGMTVIGMHLRNATLSKSMQDNLGSFWQNANTKIASLDSVIKAAEGIASGEQTPAGLENQRPPAGRVGGDKKTPQKQGGSVQDDIKRFGGVAF